MHGPLFISFVNITRFVGIIKDVNWGVKSPQWKTTDVELAQFFQIKTSLWASPPQQISAVLRTTRAPATYRAPEVLAVNTTCSGPLPLGT
ncbi:hypothetical protein RSOLAG1IB_08342 [Rhizoctonia solani AG-1 IB]|uniref:Uncharacterized protein n=1 Tax=Thanatephorus cucumeris (strain AG1-IB / isolate 7/3/14) TaxID=1108050 RepID=A0A0B7FHL5_THACB|nr:hypothetical protein RSOLAG1IB_08342 [Rhizoctonia solani AG-1 IB]